MGTQISGVNEGILTMTVSGTLTQSELTQAQQSMADIIRAHGKIRILVLAGDFAGWESGGAWDDFSFQDAFDPYIEKMAIVGDTRWEDLALIFVAKGLRSFPIEYFATGERNLAQAWLKASQ